MYQPCDGVFDIDPVLILAILVLAPTGISLIKIGLKDSLDIFHIPRINSYSRGLRFK